MIHHFSCKFLCVEREGGRPSSVKSWLGTPCSCSLADTTRSSRLKGKSPPKLIITTPRGLSSSNNPPYFSFPPYLYAGKQFVILGRVKKLDCDWLWENSYESTWSHQKLQSSFSLLRLYEARVDGADRNQVKGVNDSNQVLVRVHTRWALTNDRSPVF